MIVNKVFRLKKDSEVGKDMPLKAGQEIEVVNDVCYVNGNPLPPALQSIFLNWVLNNPTLFIDDTRTW
jgi:hypothetical protein